ncbi:MAG: hypothetical protein ABH821_06310, partial [archaeon]
MLLIGGVSALGYETDLDWQSFDFILKEKGTIKQSTIDEGINEILESVKLESINLSNVTNLATFNLSVEDKNVRFFVRENLIWKKVAGWVGSSSDPEIKYSIGGAQEKKLSLGEVIDLGNYFVKISRISPSSTNEMFSKNNGSFSFRLSVGRLIETKENASTIETKENASTIETKENASTIETKENASTTADWSSHSNLSISNNIPETVDVGSNKLKFALNSGVLSVTPLISNAFGQFAEGEPINVNISNDSGKVLSSSDGRFFLYFPSNSFFVNGISSILSSSVFINSFYYILSDNQLFNVDPPSFEPLVPSLDEESLAIIREQEKFSEIINSFSNEFAAVWTSFTAETINTLFPGEYLKLACYGGNEKHVLVKSGDSLTSLYKDSSRGCGNSSPTMSDFTSAMRLVIEKNGKKMVPLEPSVNGNQQCFIALTDIGGRAVGGKFCTDSIEKYVGKRIEYEQRWETETKDADIKSLIQKIVIEEEIKVELDNLKDVELLKKTVEKKRQRMVLRNSCLTPELTSRSGLTGDSALTELGFNDRLMTWNPEEISFDSCELKYCDGVQLTIANAKKAKLWDEFKTANKDKINKIIIDYVGVGNTGNLEELIKGSFNFGDPEDGFDKSKPFCDSSIKKDCYSVQEVYDIMSKGTLTSNSSGLTVPDGFPKQNAILNLKSFYKKIIFSNQKVVNDNLTDSKLVSETKKFVENKSLFSSVKPTDFEFDKLLFKADDLIKTESGVYSFLLKQEAIDSEAKIVFDVLKVSGLDDKFKSNPLFSTPFDPIE